MTGALSVRADALRPPLRSGSVNLFIFSPPYFSLRSYQDDGEHYDGQIGSEPHPRDYVEALWAVMRGLWDPLAGDGLVVVNLGDKRAQSGSHNNATLSAARTLTRMGRDRARAANVPRSYSRASFGRRKSKELLPHRFAIGCVDGEADPEGKGWILVQDVVWDKANGIPESTRDRPRDSHEYWFLFAKSERFYSAVDELREPHAETTIQRAREHRAPVTGKLDAYQEGMSSQQIKRDQMMHPLGSMPGSVRRQAAEPLKTPTLRVVYRGETRRWFFDEADAFEYMRSEGLKHGRPSLRREVPHFAAFPTTWPEWFIRGWSPPAVCCECRKGRWPVASKALEADHLQTRGRRDLNEPTGNARGMNGTAPNGRSVVRIIGYACDCTPYTDHPGKKRGRGRTTWSNGQVGLEGVKDDGGRVAPREDVPRREYHLEGWTPPPSKPAVVCDVFGGTGTTALVAKALGRLGLSIDLSGDYARLTRWRLEQSGHDLKVIARVEGSKAAKAEKARREKVAAGQGSLL